MSNFDKCPLCGSIHLKLIDEKNKMYKCLACENVFQKSQDTSNDSINDKKPKTKIFFDKLMSKVVELNAYFENDIFSGTGFFISNEYILTNAHVIMRNHDDTYQNAHLAISITGNDYSKTKRYLFDIVTADLKLDIAILKVQKGKSDFVSFANNIYNGEPVYAIGNSHGEGLCIIEGIVSDVSRQIDSRELFMTTALATKGNSGCPVFNTNGQLLGMITEGSKKALSMIYAIPFKVLLDFIRNAEKKECIKII